MNTPPRIKLFVAILARPQVERSHILELLTEVFGSIDFLGPERQFDVTSYYEEEMGKELVRSFVSFTGPHHAEILPDAKRGCIELERGCAIEDGGVQKRTVNLDIGYLDRHKIVFASTKEAGHKIYLHDDIYADLVARYSQKAFQPLPWCFPDIADGRYNEELLAIRSLFIDL
jgi:hypothetical protein